MGCCSSAANGEASRQGNPMPRKKSTDADPRIPKPVHRILMTTTSLSINQNQTKTGPAKLRSSAEGKTWKDCYLVLKGNYLFSGVPGVDGISGRPDQMIFISEDTSIQGGGGHAGDAGAGGPLVEGDEDGDDVDSALDAMGLGLGRENSMGALSRSMAVTHVMDDLEDGPRSPDSLSARDSLEPVDDHATLRIEDAHGQIWALQFDQPHDLEGWSTTLRDVVADSQLLTRYPALLHTIQEGSNFSKKNYQAGSSIFSSAKKDQVRFVQLSRDCTSITWQKVVVVEEGGAGGANGQPPGTVLSEEYDEIKVADVTRVVRGAETDVFRRMGSKKVDKNLCFSVVSGKRTLDLVASSEAERDLWVSALQGAVKFGSGYGGLEATKKALEERGDTLFRIVEKSNKLKEAAEEYQKNSESAKGAARRGSSWGF